MPRLSPSQLIAALLETSQDDLGSVDVLDKHAHNAIARLTQAAGLMAQRIMILENKLAALGS